jgi:hypothetical protein
MRPRLEGTPLHQQLGEYKRMAYYVRALEKLVIKERLRLIQMEYQILLFDIRKDDPFKVATGPPTGSAQCRTTQPPQHDGGTQNSFA